MVLGKGVIWWSTSVLHLGILVLFFVGVNFALEVKTKDFAFRENPVVIDQIGFASEGSRSSPSSSKVLSAVGVGSSSSSGADAVSNQAQPPPGSRSLMEKAHNLFITMMYKSEIPGLPGKDYPILADIPMTTRFRCRDHYNVGYYADVDSGCQVIHVCQADGSHESFLCPNGTIFNQQYFVCDWWFNVDCNQSPIFYKLNGGIGKVAEVKADDYKSQSDDGINDSHVVKVSTEIKAHSQTVSVPIPVPVPPKPPPTPVVESGVSEKDYFQESRIVQVIKH